MLRRLEEVDMLFGDTTAVKRAVAFWGKAISVESDKWVVRLGELQGIIQTEQTGQVLRIGD